MDGLCTVTSQKGVELSNVTSLINDVTFFCKNWTDPEEQGIKNYVIYSVDGDGQKTPMLKVAYFDPSTPVKAILSPGEYTMQIYITDKWGSQTPYTIPDPSGTKAQKVNVYPPSCDEMEIFEKSGKLAELSGSGDSSTMMMILAAKSAIGYCPAKVEVVEVEPGVATTTLSPEELKDNAAVAAGQVS